MKNFIALIAFIAITTSFTACKKGKAEAPEKEEAVAQLDMKQYVITGTLTRVIGNTTFEHPYLVTFDEGGQCSIYDFSAVGRSSASYTFDNNVLTVNYGGTTNWIFNISGETISKTSNMQANFLTQNLYKIPSSNQFAGNWYSGMLNSRENRSSMFFAFKFTDSQFQETVHIASQTYNYTLIKNIMAIASENGIARYFLALNGKLSVSRYNFGVDPPANFFNGALSKDQ